MTIIFSSSHKKPATDSSVAGSLFQLFAPPGVGVPADQLPSARFSHA